MVYRCEGYDTSAFAQLCGSYYEYIVDSCTVDRSQGAWGQSGWFVQFRYNTIRYGVANHPKIGMPGPDWERNAPFGYTGLTDGNLRITKFGSAQYKSPANRALFVKDVAPHPVPGVRGCIVKRNELSYNQRILMGGGKDPMSRMGANDFLRMTDIVIDHNTIRHGAVGISISGLVNNVLASGNRFEDVTTPLVGNPAVVLAIDEAGPVPTP